MADVPFTKMQGVGNDFVVVDGRGKENWPALAVEMCDRQRGVGADGLLVLDASPVADILMRMYNPDGSPDVCGNGLRCLARFAVERGIVQTDILNVQTLAGVRSAEVLRDGAGTIYAVRVDMGLPRFEPQDIPMRVALNPVVDYPLELEDGQILTVTALSTGSTHTMAFVPTLPNDLEFFALSPQVEHHSLFPERTSLMWCEREGVSRLKLRIWERGAGETWGCGTGACASAVAAIVKGLVPPDKPVTISSKGGELSISWQPSQTIQMTGPAEFVYNGVYASASS